MRIKKISRAEAERLRREVVLARRTATARRMWMRAVRSGLEILELTSVRLLPGKMMEITARGHAPATMPLADAMHHPTVQRFFMERRLTMLADLHEFTWNEMLIRAFVLTMAREYEADGHGAED